MPDAITSMAYNAENGPPWHGKGVPLNGLATAAECIKSAGLDWAVVKVPLRLADDGGVPLSRVMATVRTDMSTTDQRRVLGIVGEEYQPLQNWDAFGFFDGVVGAGRAIYETAGAIAGGSRIWLLAKVPRPIAVRRDDEVNPYLLLANGHDGQLMVHVKFTPVRVVCQNTLAMALHERRGPHVAMRHDRQLKRRLRSTAEILKAVDATLSEAAEVWLTMAGAQLAVKDAERYFRDVFGPHEHPAAEEDPQHEGSDTADWLPTQKPLLGLKKLAMDDFESAQNRTLGIEGTVWAAYNAAVWAIDHGRSNGRDRVDDLCLAAGAAVKERALTLARGIIEAG